MTPGHFLIDRPITNPQEPGITVEEDNKGITLNVGSLGKASSVPPSPQNQTQKIFVSHMKITAHNAIIIMLNVIKTKLIREV